MAQKKEVSVEELIEQRDKLLDQICTKAYLPGEYRYGIFQQLRVVHFSLQILQNKTADNRRCLELIKDANQRLKQARSDDERAAAEAKQNK